MHFLKTTHWITNVPYVIVSGIDTAPIKRSAKAMLDDRTFEDFEFFFNSLLVFTAIITKWFNRIVTGQAMVMMATMILTCAI